MPPVGFETAISAGERPQTYGLDRAANGTTIFITLKYKIILYILTLQEKNNYYYWSRKYSTNLF